MKIAILGAGGMAGHLIHNYLSKLGYNCTPYYHTNCQNKLLIDAEDEENISGILKKIIFDYSFVINCIGVLVKESEENPEKAIRVNALFPRILERYTAGTGTKVIHLSTDCVFLGSLGGYREDSPKDGLSIYSKTKALGEINNSKDITIRTSLIGPEIKDEGKGLFDWFMKQSDSAIGYADHFWSGVTTLELAKAIDYLMKNHISGIIHLTNNKKISKYDLLTIINEYRPDNKIIIHKHYTGKIIDRSLISTLEKFKYKVPGYEEMIINLFDYMRKHKDIYKNKYSFLKDKDE